MVLASSDSSVVVLFVVCGASMAVGIGCWWHWINHLRWLAVVDANWAEIEGEIVSYAPIPASDDDSGWWPVFAFQVGPDQRVKGRGNRPKSQRNRGEVGVPVALLYDPEHPDAFITADIRRVWWGTLLFGAFFFCSGLAMLIAGLLNF